MIESQIKKFVKLGKSFTARDIISTLDINQTETIVQRIIVDMFNEKLMPGYSMKWYDVGSSEVLVFYKRLVFWENIKNVLRIV